MNNTLVKCYNQTLHNAHTASYDYKYYLGAIAAVIASFSRGCNTVMVSYLYTNQSTKSVSLICFYQGLSGILVAFVALPFNTTTITHSIDSTTVYGLMAVAVFGILINGLANKSVQLIGSIMESFIRSTDVIVAYTIQIIFFHQCSDYVSIIGATLVIISIMLISIEDVIINKLSDSNCLKKVL